MKYYVGLDDLSSRVLRLWGFLRLVRAYRPAGAIVSCKLAGYGRSSRRRGAYALIAAISGVMPNMFMRRLRL
jgi:hypothetical protein